MVEVNAKYLNIWPMTENNVKYHLIVLLKPESSNIKGWLGRKNMEMKEQSENYKWF